MAQRWLEHLEYLRDLRAGPAAPYLTFPSVDAIEFILTYSSSLDQMVSSPEFSFPAERYRGNLSACP